MASAASGVPCVAVCGRLGADSDAELRASGLDDVLPLTSLARDTDDAMRRAAVLVEDAVAALVGRAPRADRA